MRTSKIDLIVKRIQKELNDLEQQELDNLIDSDPDFKKDNALADDLISHLADDQTHNFKTKLQNVQSDYFKNKNMKTNIIPFKHFWQYAVSIASIVIIAFASMYLLNQNQTSEQLFEQYYNLDDVYLNTRSGSTNTTDILEKGLLLFEKDEYKKSIDYFEQLPNSITAIYYSGVAHMELKEYEVAIFKFDQVIDDYLNVFYDQATWYKGLCMLKQEKRKEAHNIFKTISKSNSYYSQQAEELSNSLK